nr:helix-turn-helix transcriptional regulator [uncultured Cohaesibacter sp.]
MTKRYGKSPDELQRWYLREWRKHRGLTQEQLAEAIESTKQTVSRMESGMLPYNQPFLEACADVLKCQPAELLIGAPIQDETLQTIVNSLKSKSPSELSKIASMITLLEQ